MAVKTKTPTPITSTTPRIPAPASQATRAPGTRPSTSATSSRLAVSPQAVNTSQQRRSAAQTPAPVPNSQKQKTPITLPSGLNAQEKKDAGLIGRVLDTTPKFAEFVANQAASGQLSSKQLNDLAYIAKQGQVHGRTDRQVITSLGKAMNGMQPSVQKAFLQEFGRAMVQDTWGNLKKFNDGIDAAGREAVTGLVTATLHPRDTFRNAQTAVVNGVAKGREELQLVGQATGLRPGNPQAARNQLGQQANAAGRYVRGIASDPGKIGATTFNAMSLVLPIPGGRAALAAAGREAAAVGERAVGAVGRSTVGQTATQAVNSVKARGNEVINTVAQGMFGGGGPPGMRPALVPAGSTGSVSRHSPRPSTMPQPTGVVRNTADGMAKTSKGVGQSAEKVPQAGALQTRPPITGTVFDDMKATQPVYPGSVIPRSFELKLDNGDKVWVHGNATEHFAEYAAGKSKNFTPEAVRVASQVHIKSLQAALSKLAEDGIVHEKLVKVDGWEIIVGAPKKPGDLPVIFHARLTE